MIKYWTSLEQGSKEWLELRKKHIGASEVAAVFGECPFKSPSELYNDKISLLEVEQKKGNWVMRRGQRLEPEARALINKQLNRNFNPIVVTNSAYPWLLASLDGLHEGTVLEIKCPGHKTWTEFCHSLKVPKHYNLQIQTQMLVSELNECIFAMYYEGEVKMIVVDACPETQREILNKTAKFWQRIQECKPPEPSAKEFELLENDHLNQLSQDYFNSYQHYSFYKSRLEELRAQILTYGDKKNFRTRHLNIKYQVRPGALDPEKLKEEFKITDDQLNKCRKAACETYSISLDRKKGS